jgi:hypothetical protein
MPVTGAIVRNQRLQHSEVARFGSFRYLAAADGERREEGDGNSTRNHGGCSFLCADNAGQSRSLSVPAAQTHKEDRTDWQRLIHARKLTVTGGPLRSRCARCYQLNVSTFYCKHVVYPTREQNLEFQFRHVEKSRSPAPGPSFDYRYLRAPTLLALREAGRGPVEKLRGDETRVSESLRFQSKCKRPGSVSINEIMEMSR